MALLNFNHPQDVSMTYVEHLCFTWKEGARSLLACVIMFIHGVFPPVLDWWYNDHITKSKQRVDKVNEGRIIG